ncbi:aldehyde dehydrogenase iron-sulfur subunit PaoA [Pararhizobium mangrovi]|uniref:Aldehyde oxidoreductase iron-sulfur-binding subunit PaoA n=1 Tax=Pararhizobium mangrovi TaxID=2590452 RepID=A0A506U3P2_9HYPH|nr:aldehyde dehydrogenase iron-sulfur subunit PaoA [Pararhizobium mangrovi]TPW27169.1 aldehyde dehydrogenase iron-sulfur subunit [Pararhizobium mangrovi]
MSKEKMFEINRRDLMIVGAATAASTGLPATAYAEATPEAVVKPDDLASLDDTLKSTVSFTVNGEKHELSVDNRTTLLDALRERMQLTGTKKGCDHGQCGACTITVNGRRINSCLTLAALHDGDEIVTIEGLGQPDNLHPMQAAFIEHDGYQCGYCTPGQICSAKETLEEIKAGIPSNVTKDLSGPIEATDDEIRERMSGNICRCGAYSNILAAINDVKGQNA